MKVPQGILTNKYFIVLAFTFVWMIFFDRYRIPSHYKISKEIAQLEGDLAFYSAEIQRKKKEKADLFGDPEVLEKFAREKYLMKRKNEDLFIIVEE